MFTPPPSPLPGPGPAKPFAPSDKLASAADEPQPTYAPDQTPRKRRIGRRMRWAALVVPCVLILITASTRYVTHPAAFDVLADASHSTWSDLAHWTPHKRHPQEEVASDSSSVASVTTASITDIASLTQAALAVESNSASASPTPSTTTGAPTVPSDPVLPTPFPQPFDSDLTQNYSSVSCFNFFNNMTNTEPFRRCRAFSLLWQSSSAFIGAQSNVTLMNTLVWGTCNTPVDADACSANMAWFAGELQTACAADLKDGNTRVTETLTAIRAYDVMRKAACLVDESTGAYCFVKAVAGTDSADKYTYNLPLGLPIPSTTAPSCSSCAQDVFQIYADALQNSSATLDGLQLTYEDAVETTNQKCGQSYATAIVKSNGARERWPWSWSAPVTLVVVAAALVIQ
ncbi:hypothetical protein EV121DRAFT_251988 [Schizophyllum commune]